MKKIVKFIINLFKRKRYIKYRTATGHYLYITYDKEDREIANDIYFYLTMKTKTKDEYIAEYYYE